VQVIIILVGLTVYFRSRVWSNSLNTLGLDRIGSTEPNFTLLAFCLKVEIT